MITRMAGLAALLLCFATGAFAAPPKVSGKYAFISQTFCEAQLIVVKDSKGFVKDVNPKQSGMMSTAVGYITFTPSSATEGTAAITGSTLVEGGAVSVDNSGFKWKVSGNNAPDAPYSFTGNSFTYSGQKYQMVFSDADSNPEFFRSVYMMRLAKEGSNSDCVETIWATKVAAPE